MYDEAHSTVQILRRVLESSVQFQFNSNTGLEIGFTKLAQLQGSIWSAQSLLRSSNSFHKMRPTCVSTMDVDIRFPQATRKEKKMSDYHLITKKADYECHYNTTDYRLDMGLGVYFEEWLPLL